jgi:hypothetical protein
LKSESNQIKIENRRLNDNVFDLMVDIEELEQYGRRNSLRFHNVPITKEELNKTEFFHHRAQKTILLVLHQE